MSNVDARAAMPDGEPPGSLEPKTVSPSRQPRLNGASADARHDAAPRRQPTREPAQSSDSIPKPRVVRPESDAAPQPRKLLDQVRDAIHTRHYSYRTEEAYVGWVKRFILFHHKRHPAQMGKPEIERFLTSLAVEWHVSASTQNQALAAISSFTRKCWRAIRGGSTMWYAPSGQSGFRRCSPDRRPRPSWAHSTASVGSWRRCSMAQG